MLNESYLISAKRLPEVMEAIQNAGVPSRFTHEFLKSLGFKGTNDRAFIAVLKGIGFLDESGAPTDKYRAYKNRSEAKKILGQALKDSYEDLFLANEKANDLTVEKLKGVFATKTGKGDAVVTKMATTFKSLANLADFRELPIKISEEKVEKDEGTRPVERKTLADFHYNIQIHLPITKDISVYNAIFKSIKDHLL